MQIEEKEKSNYNKIVKYTGLFGGIQAITLLTSILRNKLIAVILGPSGLGLISLYNSVVKLLYDSTNLGISFSGIRNISEVSASNNPEKLIQYIKTIRKWSLLTGLLGIFTCIILSPTLSYWTFNDYKHIIHFIILSPAIALMTISGGELAILKGTRQIKRISYISVLNVIIALIISVPLYYIFNTKAIIPSIVIVTLATTSITILYSVKIYPFRLNKSFKKDLSAGKNMIKVGVPFILAGVLGSGAEYIIRAFLLKNSSEATLGLYNAGYILTVTYAAMIFAAMESDYFPRLSAVNNQIKKLKQVANQQIEIAVLLITPLLIIFLLFLPIILSLLYSSKFLPVIRMAELASLGMFFKAISLPLAYITLARGEAFIYLLLECLYDICIVLLVIFLFRNYDLNGTGIAITLGSFFNLIIVYLCVRFKYKFRFSKEMLQTVFSQLPWISIAFILNFYEKNIYYWIIGIASLLVSSYLSFYFLNKKTTLITSIRNRLKT